jgi:RNA polymerase sigma-70 factor (ECF subfamily)
VRGSVALIGGPERTGAAPIDTRLGTPSSTSDADLIERVAANDEAAFRELFVRYGTAARALAGRVVGQPQLAEEVVQDAFLVVWRTSDRFDQARGSLRAWLFGIVHHRAVDAVRREQAQRRRAARLRARAEVDGEAGVVSDPTDDVLDAMEGAGRHSAVREALRCLPVAQRDVLIRMYFDGLTQSQVASRRATPLGTVKSRALLGMRRLRAALADGDPSILGEIR